MLLGYARVSKGEEQDTRMQETALRAAGVERLFTERTSGSPSGGPGGRGLASPGTHGQTDGRQETTP